MAAQRGFRKDPTCLLQLNELSGPRRPAGSALTPLQSPHNVYTDPFTHDWTSRLFGDLTCIAGVCTIRQWIHGALWSVQWQTVSTRRQRLHSMQHTLYKTSMFMHAAYIAQNASVYACSIHSTKRQRPLCGIHSTKRKRQHAAYIQPNVRGYVRSISLPNVIVYMVCSKYSTKRHRLHAIQNSRLYFTKQRLYAAQNSFHQTPVSKRYTATLLANTRL